MERKPLKLPSFQRQPKNFKAKFEPFDLIYALQNAAEFLELEEWPDDDNGAQEAANREAAKRIRKMAKRIKM